MIIVRVLYAKRGPHTTGGSHSAGSTGPVQVLYENDDGATTAPGSYGDPAAGSRASADVNDRLVAPLLKGGGNAALRTGLLAARLHPRVSTA